jgi:SOS-response transcriptional repressor LexA
MTTLLRGSEKRNEIVAFVGAYIAEKAISPTLTEIAEGVNLRSPSNVRSHLLVLQAEGRVTLQNGKFRTIRLVPAARKRG